MGDTDGFQCSPTSTEDTHQRPLLKRQSELLKIMEQHVTRIAELEDLVARLDLEDDIPSSIKALDEALIIHCRIAYRARQAVEAHDGEDEG